MLTISKACKELHVPSQPVPHFEGSWDELLQLVEDHYDRRVKMADGVYAVELPPERFKACAIPRTRGMKLEVVTDLTSWPLIVTRGEKPQAKTATAIVVEGEITVLLADTSTEESPMHYMLMRELMDDEPSQRHVFNGDEYFQSLTHWMDMVNVYERT
jgi:hypothetical protein